MIENSQRELEIRIDLDKIKRTITISDTGNFINLKHQNSIEEKKNYTSQILYSKNSESGHNIIFRDF